MRAARDEGRPPAPSGPTDNDAPAPFDRPDDTSAAFDGTNDTPGAFDRPDDTSAAFDRPDDASAFDRTDDASAPFDFTDDTSSVQRSRGETGDDKRRGPLSPGKGFLVVLIPLGILFAVLFLARQDAPPAPDPAPDLAESFQLTNAEAIDRFKELDALAEAALHERDAAALHRIFTPDSPAGERATTAIRRLKRGSIIRATREDTKNVSVISNGSSEIRIREVLVIDSRFVDEAGRDATAKRFVERRTVEWTMRRVYSEWLLHDGVIVAARRLKGQPDSPQKGDD